MDEKQAPKKQAPKKKTTKKRSPKKKSSRNSPPRKKRKPAAKKPAPPVDLTPLTKSLEQIDQRLLDLARQPVQVVVVDDQTGSEADATKQPAEPTDPGEWDRKTLLVAHEEYKRRKLLAKLREYRDMKAILDPPAED